MNIVKSDEVLNKLLIKSFFLITIAFTLVLWGDDFAEYFWKDHQEAITSVATLIASIMAIMATLFVVIEIIRFERQSKRQRTYELISKYYQPDYAICMVKTRKFLVSNDIPDVKWHIFTNPNEKDYESVRTALLVCFNFFEDLSHMYNKDLVDRSVLFDSCSDVLIDLYDLSNWLIERIKTTYGNNDTLIQWKTCRDSLERERTRRGNH